ncbi:MAG: hypothetical protein MK135_01830 [Polyangiaceae bacterium]|nr:hypothetical protein [Polyangiaceae bacterium]
MLFGYLNPPQADYKDDVQSTEAALECFAFDRPLLLPDELHVAGAMAFATTFGFGGMSLIEWALLQSLENSPESALDFLTPPNTEVPQNKS